MIGTSIGPYRITAKLGAGGMGEVYRAHDTKLKRDVALKVLPEAFARDPERLARFEREAEVLASLNNPNIATIHGVVEDRALVMELVEGAEPKGPLPFDEAWAIMSQVAAALDYAHQKGVVHRDLKPANIKVTVDGQVKLLDFGLAKAFSNQPDVQASPEISPTLTIGATQAGVILGTAAYMSPEQAKGKSVDKRADIWAFGVVLYELFTGERPFKGEDVSETLAQVLTTQPDLNKVPAKVRTLLRRCLEKDPKKRLRDIGDALSLLDESEIAPSPAGQSKVPWIIAGASLTAMAMLGLIFLRFSERRSEPQLFEYAVPTPEGTALDEFALSPNARYLVMRAVTERGPQLWLRALDTLQTQPLAGTDGAAYPFWSPDSNSIGFFAEKKLKKISVSGGPAQTLCDAPSGRGGTWNQQGVIVFAPSNTGGLSRVSSVGGVPVEITKGSGLRFPTFLPDGRRFLYEAPAEDQGIYAGSLDSKEHHRILTTPSTPAYEPPRVGDRNGYVLFVREYGSEHGTLMAQPVDPKSLDPRGDVFPVAEQVARGRGRFTWLYSIAPTSGALAYRTGSPANLELTWIDRQGKVIEKVGDPAAYGDIAISPDGTRVAAARADGSIWITDLSHGGSTRFTFGAGTSQSPVWSPDGGRIAYRFDRAGGTDVYQKAVNGATSEELLLPSDQYLFKTPSGWSPDRSLLLYTVSDAKTKGDIWVLPMNGQRKPSPLLRTEFSEGHAMFSPDGRWFAYYSDESGRFEVYVRPFSASSPQTSGDKIAGKWIISKSGGTLLRWINKEIIYVTPDRNLVSVEVSTAPAFQIVQSRVLFQLPLGAIADVTRDGKRFLVALPIKETAPTQLTVITNWQASVKR